MLKEFDPPKEPLKTTVERKWRNNAIRKRLIEERQKPKLVDPNKKPEMAETIANIGRRDGPVQRFERQFLKDIRAIMNEPNEQKLAMYRAAIEHRRFILLREKLRRLQAAHPSLAQQEASK